jgi:GNAT superfamily N-acetyltransferase
MPITLRRANLADAAHLADLLHRIDLFPAVQTEQPDATRARIQRHLAQCLQDDSHSVYIAEDQAQGPVAYAAVHWLPYLIFSGPEGFVSELFVDEAARGQGVGTRLLDAVVAEARQRGCYRLSLTNMRSRESYQRQFYNKLGWEERPDAINFIYIL